MQQIETGFKMDLVFLAMKEYITNIQETAHDFYCNNTMINKIINTIK